MKTVFLVVISFFISLNALSQFKKDRLYKKISNNITEIENFKQYLLLRNYNKDFKESIVYEWQKINDNEVKRFCKKFGVSTIHIMPKSKYPISTDFFIEDDNRIELVFNTICFFSRNRVLVYDCSKDGLKLKNSLSFEHKIVNGIYLF